jgi:hypothetical protein
MQRLIFAGGIPPLPSPSPPLRRGERGGVRGDSSLGVPFLPDQCTLTRPAGGGQKRHFRTPSTPLTIAPKMVYNRNSSGDSPCPNPNRGEQTMKGQTHRGTIGVIACLYALILLTGKGWAQGTWTWQQQCAAATSGAQSATPMLGVAATRTVTPSTAISTTGGFRSAG